MISKAHVMAICAGDSWIDKGANLILSAARAGGRGSARIRASKCSLRSDRRALSLGGLQHAHYGRSVAEEVEPRVVGGSLLMRAGAGTEEVTQFIVA